MTQGVVLGREVFGGDQGGRTILFTQIDDGSSGLLTMPGIVTPEQFGARGDGVTNDYAAMQLAVATGKNVFCGQRYLLDGASPAIAVTVDGQCIFGPGELLTTSDITVIKITGNIRVNVQGLTITGNSSGSAQFGIASTDLSGGVGTHQLRLLDVTVRSLATAGILLYNATGGLNHGPIVMGCRAFNCGIGFWTLTEYTQFSECLAYACATGFECEGGNQLYVNCVGVSCTANGMKIDSAGNDGHGGIINCSFNHNTCNLRFLDNITLGMPIIGCNFYGTPGTIEIGAVGGTLGVLGARLINCAIACPLNINDHADAVIEGCLWPVTPVVAITIAATATARFDPFNVDLTGQVPSNIAAAQAAHPTAFLSTLQGVVGILPAVAAPAAPAVGYYLYVDVADGVLKAKGTGGTVTPLATP